MLKIFIATALICASSFAFAESAPTDLDTQLVQATFRIQNPKSSATVFFLTREVADGNSKKLQRILVTANHVLEKSEGDEATIFLRKKETKDGEDSWSKTPFKLKIRENGKALWTHPANLDVAVMSVTLPGDIEVPALPLDLLATDAALKKYEVHPGDTIKCVGYPHPNQFTPNEAWFPVVRHGCIASYPLVPTKKTRTFLADFNTFEGNSGGAIYLCECNRFFDGKTQDGRVGLILGLLSSQHFLDEKFTHVYESGTFRQRLGLGVILHASAIREAIDMLPK